MNGKEKDERVTKNGKLNRNVDIKDRDSMLTSKNNENFQDIPIQNFTLHSYIEESAAFDIINSYNVEDLDKIDGSTISSMYPEKESYKSMITSLRDHTFV